MPALWDSGSLQSPRLSHPIGLREVKGVGGSLEALPAGVGPLPTLLLYLNRDFSAPLVHVRDSEWEGWRISGLGYQGVISGDIAAVGLVPWHGQSFHRHKQQSGIPAPQVPACCLHRRAKPLYFWSHPAKYSLSFVCF